VLHRSVELAFRSDRLGEREHVLHEKIRTQNRERNSRLRQILLRCRVPPEEGDERIRGRSRRGDLHDVSNSSAFRCVNQIILKLSLPRIGSGDQQRSLRAVERGIECLRFPRSPSAISPPGASLAPALARLRPKAGTAAPRATSRFSVSPPTVPVAPVTSILSGMAL